MIVSDGIIFLSYMAIPAALVFTLARRRDVPFPGIVALFVAFIVACGITHAADAMMFYHPLYRLLGVIKAITAIVSLTTAVILIRSLPALLALPSIQTSNRDLKAALERESSLRHELERARSELEARTAALSQRSRRMNSALVALRGLACEWAVETGRVEWEIGYDQLATELGLPAREFRSWDGLLDERDVERLRDLCRRARERPLDPLTFEASMAGSPRHVLRLGARVEPEVRGEPATMVGVVRIMNRHQTSG